MEPDVMWKTVLDQVFILILILSLAILAVFWNRHILCRAAGAWAAETAGNQGRRRQPPALLAMYNIQSSLPGPCPLGVK